jgi:hypothetical protein
LGAWYAEEYLDPLAPEEEQIILVITGKRGSHADEFVLFSG